MSKWGWLGKGAKVAAIFVPQIKVAVAAVETIKALKGKNLAREDKAIEIAKAAVPAIEEFTGDLLNDPAVIEATRQVIRLEVAAEKAVALANEARVTVENARRDLAVLLATLPHVKNQTVDSVKG